MFRNTNILNQAVFIYGDVLQYKQYKFRLLLPNWGADSFRSEEKLSIFLVIDNVLDHPSYLKDDLLEKIWFIL